MAFLDNSGDIILDAVLTDTGRYRLAKGDGSFKVVKFALGDDEINYGSYDKNHPSGSAYYDLEIMQTPVLEAFTNNTSTMKSKLLSIPRTNLLYLPMLKLNDRAPFNKHAASGQWLVAVDLNTVGGGSASGNDGLLSPNATGGTVANAQGILNGFNPAQSMAKIRVDQGLDTTNIANSYTIDADLLETQYIIEIDNRLGSIVAQNTGAPANISFIDDDNIASYYLSTTDVQFIMDGSVEANNVINGPRGTTLIFAVQASTELTTSTYLFDKLGSSGLSVTGASANAITCRYIDTYIKVSGATTGYRIDIPVRFVKESTTT